MTVVLSDGTMRLRSFDPRLRSWYKAAKQSDMVERSELYIFASSGDSGFTLSRRFNGAVAGVMGADLAATDLARFLREQSITETSTAFIFTKTGEIIVAPGLPVVRTPRPMIRA